MDPVVRNAWAIHAGRSPAATRLLEGLYTRYAEPHRRYHGVAHLERVVTDCLDLLRTVDDVPVDRAAVILAGCYHDAIYDPRATANEARSAALAEADLVELGLQTGRLAEVVRLVLATETQLVTDTASAVLIDADLAVLGSPPAVYGEYVTGIRFEYRHVDEAGWRRGRSAVLEGLLDRPTLYTTTAARTHEQQARSNLTAELAALAA